eukprot:Selendium_serpulae@DN6299_c0_g1_i3.p2
MGDLRSPFAAVGGHRDDTFQTGTQLLYESRSCAEMNSGMIPVAPYERIGALKFLDDEDEEHNVADTAMSSRRVARNSYVLDFYIHGILDRVATQNRIPREQVWYAMMDFVKSLLTVKLVLGWCNEVKRTQVYSKFQTVIEWFVQDYCAKLSSQATARTVKKKK